MSPVLLGSANLDNSRKDGVGPALADNANLDKTMGDAASFAFPGNTSLDNLKECRLNRLPVWLRQGIPDKTALEYQRILSEFGVHTVCQQARCPNFSYCFRRREFTFIILGDVCSRNCRFCAVKKSSDENLKLDPDEPLRIAKAVEKLGLGYIVITSVNRDDLDGGGAGIFAETMSLIHKINRNIKIEVLIPDFQSKISSLKCVLDANPCVVAHNIETVERLYGVLRPEAAYGLSLGILKKIKELKPQVLTKSSLMLGLGETEAEVIETIKELKNNLCDILALGQYLAPSCEHYPVKDFITPEQFHRYRNLGLALGFKSVLSGPLVRSSYKAAEVYNEAAWYFKS